MLELFKFGEYMKSYVGNDGFALDLSQTSIVFESEGILNVVLKSGDIFSFNMSNENVLLVIESFKNYLVSK